MKVNFGSTFKVPLRYSMSVKSIETLNENTKNFIKIADENIRGDKDISVYSPIDNCYYLDILDDRKDKIVKRLAKKLCVSCYVVPRETMADKANNVILSTGKDALCAGSELDALEQVLEQN